MPAHATTDIRSGLISCAYLQIAVDEANETDSTMFYCRDPTRQFDDCKMAWAMKSCPCKDEIISHCDIQEPPYK